MARGPIPDRLFLADTFGERVHAARRRGVPLFAIARECGITARQAQDAWDIWLWRRRHPQADPAEVPTRTMFDAEREAARQKAKQYRILHLSGTYSVEISAPAHYILFESPSLSEAVAWAEAYYAADPNTESGYRAFVAANPYTITWDSYGVEFERPTSTGCPYSAAEFFDRIIA